MDQITIALIGATGRTGSEFLKLALEEGYSVKALVRTPSKVSIRNSRLKLIHGDLEDVNALAKLADGASYVVCMAAATVVDGVYPNEYMLHFVKRLYPILEKSQPQVFLYQAGSMSADGKGFLHPVAWLMKQTIGRKLKIFDKINDNNAVTRFIGENKANFKFIVTRAGVLKEGPSEKEAVTYNLVSLGVRVQSQFLASACGHRNTHEVMPAYVLSLTCLCTESFLPCRGSPSRSPTWQLVLSVP